MKEVEALKDEKRNAEQSYRNSMPRNHFQKRHCNVKNIILMQKMSLWLSFENDRQFSSSTTTSPSM